MSIVNVPYESYDHVILDASSLMYEIPEELWAYQENHPLLAAQTYESECNSYRNLLPDQMKSLFEANKRRLDGSVRPDPVFREEQYARRQFNQDAFGLLQLLCSRSTRHVLQQRSCLLVTGDLSQLESVAVYGVLSDVLFLPDGMFYNHQNTLELEDRFWGEPDEQDDLPAFPHAKNTKAYIDGGVEIELKQIHDRPASSCIYETADQTQYAKIFHEERQTFDKMEHIRHLIAFHKKLYRERSNTDWLLLPTKMLYMDPECRHPVGYLMAKAGNTTELKHMLCLERYDDTDPTWAKISCKGYSEYLQMAWLIASHAAYLKTYNLWPSDYNLTNFALHFQEKLAYGPWISGFPPKLYMWDTDSFCWNGYMYTQDGSGPRWHNYVSDRWCADLEPPGHLRTIGENCGNALYQCVFWILTLSEFPYGAERTDPPMFHFDNLSPELRTQFFYIPENLRRLFHDVFVCGHLPSVPCLLQALEQAYRECVESLTTLGERDAYAQEMAKSGAAFRPEPGAAKLVFPAYPPVPDVSAPLSVWTRNTVPFSAKRTRPSGDQSAQNRADGGKENGAAE